MKVMGEGQRSRSDFWRAAVDIRGSVLPSAAKNIRFITSLRCLSVCLLSGGVYR